MFFLNLAHFWDIATAVEPVRGIVFLPSGNSSEKLRRSPRPESQRVLFDPQLYLAALDPRECPKVCGRLVSYPWFQNPSQVPGFESGETTRTRWELGLREKVVEHWRGAPPIDEDLIHDSVVNAVRFQLEISCSHIILPTPLISEREDEAEAQAVWLDAGIKEAQDLDVGQPLLATVALSESVLNETAFEKNGFLDAIVDQVVARDGLNGVYIVIAQTHARHPFDTSREVLRAYLHLCRAFSRVSYDMVFPNFVDIFGFPCIAMGATGFASGPSQMLRRLSLEGFGEGGGGGRNLPHFYSHMAIAELLTETDLDKIVGRRLLARVRDRTPVSQALMAELGRGGSAANLPAWAESHMNTKAACRHFVHRVAIEARKLHDEGSDERAEKVRDWVEAAAANVLLIRKRLKGSVVGRIAPSEDWLDILDRAT